MVRGWTGVLIQLRFNHIYEVSQIKQTVAAQARTNANIQAGLVAGEGGRQRKAAPSHTPVMLH